MKYIIDVPEEIAKISEEFLSKAGLLCELYTEPDRKAIEDEVWEFVDCISRMSSEEGDLCFGFSSLREVTINLSYQEAKAKFEAWLKQNDEFKIGDEIKSKRTGNVGVVIEVNKEHEYVNVIFPSGTPWNFHFEEIEKTGIYFSEAVELMKKIRGEE